MKNIYNIAGLIVNGITTSKYEASSVNIVQKIMTSLEILWGWKMAANDVEKKRRKENRDIYRKISDFSIKFILIY